LVQQKILLLTTDTRIGGAERMILGLADHLDRNRFVLEVATLLDRGTLLAMLQAKGVRTHSAGFRGRWDTRGISMLKRIVTRADPDVLHTSLFHANVAGRLVGSLCGVPKIISTQHGIDKWRKPWHNLADRLTAKACWRVTAVSGATREVLAGEVGIPEDKIVVIRNGVDVSLFSPGKTEYMDGAGRSPLRVGCVATLKRVKGHRVLLNATKRLIDDGLAVELILVGEGELKDALIREAGRLGIRDRVEFSGNVDDVPSVLSTFDLFVLPSLEEGLPMSILEAMAAGVPVVATRVGGIPELIKNGKEGVLVEPGDAEELASAIENVLSSPELARSMAEEARRKTNREFSVERMVREYESLYQEAL
jgi:glycosyltransferase involved in cell wall biosynthesis